MGELFSGMYEYSFDVASGDRNAAALKNCAPYVSYLRAADRDSIIVFSPRQSDLQDFAGRFLRDTPGKYGFGMDWNRPGSFFAYVYGFGDTLSRARTLLDGPEPPGWGELYLQSEPTLFDEGLFRAIYPVNLLTTAHLTRETGSGTAQELILSRADWGGITQLADDWFLWCVPLSEIDYARREFESRGLIQNR